MTCGNNSGLLKPEWQNKEKVFDSTEGTKSSQDAGESAMRFVSKNALFAHLITLLSYCEAQGKKS